MKVVMVGHTGAGKTSYMASMYREMSTSGVNGFWVRAQRDADHRSLVRLAGAIAKSRYPKASDSRRTYDLTLRHAASPLLDFVWSDYRGGVMRDSEGQEVGEFLEDAGVADAVLLFIQATDLVSRRAAMRARIRDLTNVVFEAIDGREQAVPIIVVVTKADLVEFDETTLSPLQGFVDAAQEDMRVRATIVQTVCGPKPENVVLPVMFALYFGLRSKAETLAAEVSACSNLADQAQGRASFIDLLKSRVKGERTYAEIAAEMRRRAEYEYNELAPLLGPVDALGQMLSGVSVF